MKKIGKAKEKNKKRGRKMNRDDFFENKVS